MKFTFRPTAMLGAAALLSACGPDLSKLKCASSTECPTGYACDQASSVCIKGESKPELTLLSDVNGITFTGHLVLRVRAVDPAGIASVTLALGSSAPADAAETPAGSGIYKADVDTAALFPAQDLTVDAVFTAKNAKGATNTLTASALHIDNKGPVIGTVSIVPSSGNVYPGQIVSIGVDVGETLAVAPVVSVAPPSGSSRTASLVTVGGTTHFDYQFIPAHTDLAGAWSVSVSAQDAHGNVTTQGAGGFTLHADVAGSLALAATKTQLKLATATTITATFSKPVSALPSVSLAGSSQTVTKVSGAVGDMVFTYSLSAPSTAKEEGTHVLTVTGVTVAGETVSAALTLVYDYTSPSFALYLQGNASNDSGGAPTFSVNNVAGSTLSIQTVIAEPVLAGFSVTAKLDATTSVPLDSTWVYGQAPKFAVPNAALTDGSHSVAVTICDLAGNCGMQTSQTFKVLSSAPSFALQLPPATQAFAAGASFTIGVLTDRPLLDPGQVGAQVSIALPSPSAFNLRYSDSYTSTDVVHTYGYHFVGTVPYTVAITDGVYSMALTGKDLYGNDVAAPFGSQAAVRIKTTLPVLTYGAAARKHLIAVSPASTAWTVGSSSGEDFTQVPASSITACINPAPTLASAPCGNAQSTLAVSAITLSGFTVTVTGGSAGFLNTAVVRVVSALRSRPWAETSPSRTRCPPGPAPAAHGRSSST
jgi:hypothetical protein